MPLRPSIEEDHLRFIVYNFWFNCFRFDLSHVVVVSMHQVLSPLIKTVGFRQHVFKWGVGNKFRSVNANRFSPVHYARPKEVTLREDYFEAPDEAVQYDAVNEQWEVFWRENNKMHAKPFPIKKFGIEQSKLEANSFLQILKDSGRFIKAENVEIESCIEGVSWDDRLQSWMVMMNGKVLRYFSASKHGVAGAQRLAEEFVQSNNKLETRLRMAVNSFTKSLTHQLDDSSGR